MWFSGSWVRVVVQGCKRVGQVCGEAYVQYVLLEWIPCGFKVVVVVKQVCMLAYMLYNIIFYPSISIVCLALCFLLLVIIGIHSWTSELWKLWLFGTLNSVKFVLYWVIRHWNCLGKVRWLRKTEWRGTSGSNKWAMFKDPQLLRCTPPMHVSLVAIELSVLKKKD